MNKRQLMKLIRALQPHFPGFVHSDIILHAIPLNSVLRGICLSPKARNPDALTVSIFARPLYVPSAAPIGNWIKRVRRGLLDPRDVWHIGEFESDFSINTLVRNIRRHLGILPSVSDPCLFAKNAIRQFGRVNLEVEHHAIGLSYARCGKLKEARISLRQLLEMRPATFDNGDRLANAERMIELIDADGVEEIASLLDSWESKTVAQLRVCGFKMDEVADRWPTSNQL